MRLDGEREILCAQARIRDRHVPAGRVSCITLRSLQFETIAVASRSRELELTVGGDRARAPGRRRSSERSPRWSVALRMLQVESGAGMP